MQAISDYNCTSSPCNEIASWVSRARHAGGSASTGWTTTNGVKFQLLKDLGTSAKTSNATNDGPVASSQVLITKGLASMHLMASPPLTPPLNFLP
jgi:hypothetical protein